MTASTAAKTATKTARSAPIPIPPANKNDGGVSPTPPHPSVAKQPHSVAKQPQKHRKKKVVLFGLYVCHLCLFRVIDKDKLLLTDESRGPKGP